MIHRSRIPLVIFSLALGVGTVLASPESSSAAGTATAESAVSHRTYTSVKGDSFTSVSEKYGCTVRALKRLNGIKVTHLKPGTTLLIPGSKPVAAKAGKKSDKALAQGTILPTGKKLRHHAPVAQPVQDFDISPSVFASCPPPPPEVVAASQENEYAPPPPRSAATAFDELPTVAENHRASLLPVPDLPPSSQKTQPAPPVPMSIANAQPEQTVVPAAKPKRSLGDALADFFGGGSHASDSGEWGNRFLAETRNLAAQGICYDGSWRPDGDSHRWEMDCSNTTRYLYQVTAGIALPRTASDQYYYLHLQNKAWDVPMTASGFADTSFLRHNLKPGDLLFWENTYRPERQPPITHVMIFLGLDVHGRWIMAGSQGGRGFYNRRHSGPDVYVFDPTRYSGGYTSWLGLVRHHGRFVAYGRPLEADVKKLSVAVND